MTCVWTRVGMATIGAVLFTGTLMAQQPPAAQQPPVAQQPAEAQPPSAPNPLEDYKPEKLQNLQVLPKDMTPDAIITLMKAYNASLNVDCVFCHKGQVGKPWSTYDFLDDTKKRHEVARLMIKTTAELNEKFKDLGEMDEPVKVTCASCHRRSRHPEIEPPAAPAKGAEKAGK